MSINLQYVYAQIDVSSGLCENVFTSSYQIPMAGYVEVPYQTTEYEGKYYNQADGHWYADADFTIPCPELDW